MKMQDSHSIAKTRQRFGKVSSGEPQKEGGEVSKLRCADSDGEKQSG